MVWSLAAAQPQLDFGLTESAPDQFGSHGFEDVSDDWVSLILNDAGVDVEVDSSIPLASLESLPLPDFEDAGFAHLDLSRSSASVCCRTESTSPGVCFDDIISSYEDGDLKGFKRQVTNSGLSQGNCQSSWNNDCPWPISCQDVTVPSDAGLNDGSGCDDCPQEASANLDSHNGQRAIASSRSPESESTHASCNFPDADVNIGIIEEDAVGSEGNDLFLFVNDICTEGSGCTEIEGSSILPSIVRNPSDTPADIKDVRVCGGLHGQTQNNTLLTQALKQEPPRAVNHEGKVAGFDKFSRKRKASDRKSRSSTPEEAAVDSVERSKSDDGGGEGDDEKRRARLMRNRESAQLSRQRKKIYVDELEDKIRTMASTIAELNNTINLISAENINLRRQLGVICPPVGQQPGGIPVTAPWGGAYPGPAVGGRFMVPGSHVPLVPIPRWRSQQATVKPTKRSKPEIQQKGSEAKMPKKPKKLAGIAAIGFFFFMILLSPLNLNFLGLKPIIRENDVTWAGHSDTAIMRPGGRVLTALTDRDESRLNDSMTKWETSGNDASKTLESDIQTGKVEEDWQKLINCDSTDVDNRVHNQQAYDCNGSMPLAAALFVPRNDRLVRIDGNLIIHSVLAGDKAMIESRNLDKGNEEPKKEAVKTQETNHRGSVGGPNLKALAVKAATEEEDVRVELQRAFASESRFDCGGRARNALQEDGSLQQWFIEGLAGPVFSSGKCTEVLQFDASVSAASSSTTAASHKEEPKNLVKNNTATLQEHGPRRVGRWVSSSKKAVPYAVPLPPVGHKDLLDGNNVTGSSERNEMGERFDSQKYSHSSMVVSVLAGSQLGDLGSLSGGSKGLPKIFVVVLIDGVKYVTYSCMLPTTGPHLQFVMN